MGRVPRGARQGEGGGRFSLLAAAGLAAAAGAGRSRAPERRARGGRVRIAASGRREERSGRTAHVRFECNGDFATVKHIHGTQERSLGSQRSTDGYVPLYLNG